MAIGQSLLTAGKRLLQSSGRGLNNATRAINPIHATNDLLHSNGGVRDFGTYLGRMAPTLALTQPAMAAGLNNYGPSSLPYIRTLPEVADDTNHGLNRLNMNMNPIERPSPSQRLRMDQLNNRIAEQALNASYTKSMLPGTSRTAASIVGGSSPTAFGVNLGNIGASRYNLTLPNGTTDFRGPATPQEYEQYQQTFNELAPYFPRGHYQAETLREHLGIR